MNKKIFIGTIFSSLFLVGCASATTPHTNSVKEDSNNTIVVNSSCSLEEEQPEVVYQDQITNVSVKEKEKEIIVINYHNNNESCIFPVTSRK